MRKTILAATFLTLALTAAQAHAPSSPAKLLAGRDAGKPVDCINSTNVLDTQTFDDGSIYYRMTGKVDYVNRPAQCSQLNSRMAYATVVPSTHLCSGDSLRVYDPLTRGPQGSCSFDNFVPYPKRK
jgi:hypothetical protein